MDWLVSADNGGSLNAMVIEARICTITLKGIAQAVC